MTVTSFSDIPVRVDYATRQARDRSIVNRVLNEIRSSLRLLIESGKSSVIDLRSLPRLRSATYQSLQDALSMGEVTAVIAAEVKITVRETQYPGVWWLTHAHEQGGTTIENLILNLISLDYQGTLMAAAGEQAEERLRTATQQSGYVLVVDGSIPAQWDNGYFISGGRSGVARFRDAAKNAKLIIAVGTCASFGGLPKAAPNPTGAVSIQTLMGNLGISKPLINLSGCPPIPEVTTGVILYYLARGMPDLDDLHRPSMFYGETVHDECYREEAYDDGPLAHAFDDAAARRGGCLIKLGCKGPVTHNACATIKWNQGTSFPMMSGHGCIGCSEPDFWDRLNLKGQKGFYVPLAASEGDDDEGDDDDHGPGRNRDDDDDHGRGRGHGRGHGDDHDDDDDD